MKYDKVIDLRKYQNITNDIEKILFNICNKVMLEIPDSIEALVILKGLGQLIDDEVKLFNKTIEDSLIKTGLDLNKSIFDFVDKPIYDDKTDNYS